ncbi:MAG: DUF4157 domain-containing protein [Pyrinomonadaceae bacterium]
MHLDRVSHTKFQEFFRDFYGDDKIILPEIQVYSRRISLLITAVLQVNGITLGRHIFINPQFTFRDSNNRLCAPKALIAHELTHTMQYTTLGFFGFLDSYLSAFWKLLRKSKKWDFDSRMQAYLDIPQEIEARRAARVYMSQKSDYLSTAKH